MASSEQLELSNFIKTVHKNLRLQAQCVGPEEAWHNHCKQTEVLDAYASAMHRLASLHWEKNLQSQNNSSRISWIVSKCMEYFFKGGFEQVNEKEKQKSEVLAKKYDLINIDLSREETDESASYWIRIKSVDIESESDIIPTVDLLDVGSCYNPFGQFNFFNVLALDIAPACSEVQKCDFLKVEIVNNVLDEVKSSLCKLKSKSFDVVVFSLFLEYLPSPNQRHLCCSKAYDLLRIGGLLFIITPDSKHSTANATIMKSWRIVLGTMGFSRLYYEKLTHVHCMAFRKSVYPLVPRHWAETVLSKKQVSLDEVSINIPQDFNEEVPLTELEVEQDIPRDECESTVIADMFSQLPEI